MGLLVEGQWKTDWYDTKATQGRFVRKPSQFRHKITSDAEFKAEANRYHLYVSLACPWAHRTLIFRKLKGLEDIISYSVVQPYMGGRGWTFENGGDSLYHAQYLYEIYLKADSQYTGRVTVPVLWDKKTGTMVNNESSEIIRMLNFAFDHLGANPIDFYPESLRSEIDDWNAFIYPSINNGVYRAGFATTQEAYGEAVQELFAALERLENHLSTRTYLVGEQITEADWRLFTTLIRFDPVYVGHFKCNLKRIVDYPHLSAYVKRLYHVPGVAETVNFEHIKNHYYQSHSSINPTGIVPLGPQLDYL